MNGMVKWVLILVIWLIFFISSIILTMFWLVHWTSASDYDSPSYILIFSLIGLANVLGSCFLQFSYVFSKLFYTLHKKMILRLLYAPLNEYFEVVPVASILMKLSKDLNIIDLVIFTEFSYVKVTFCSFIGVSIIYLLAGKYYFFIIILVYISLIILLQSFSVVSGRELNRL